MTVRDLMSGYTAYTDALELSAARGTHAGWPVTTTELLTTLAFSPDDLAAQGSVSISVYDRQATEYACG